MPLSRIIFPASDTRGSALLTHTKTGIYERAFDDTDAESIAMQLQVPEKATQITVTLVVRGVRAVFILHSGGSVLNLDEGEFKADFMTILALGGNPFLPDDDFPVLEIDSPDKYRFMKMGPFPIPSGVSFELVVTRVPDPRGLGDVHLSSVNVEFDA